MPGALAPRLDGPPPPARRAQARGCRARRGHRPTSACAERTVRAALASRFRYLRLRGEGRAQTVHPSCPSGSPPPARRGRWTGSLRRIQRRFTFARAESTSSPRPVRSWHAAHLRLRGDHNPALQQQGAKLRFTCGWPPLARRPHGVDPCGSRCLRFTSARAETTSSPRLEWPEGVVHLRSRGDHRTRTGSRSARNGSPPLARRPLSGNADVWRGIRFTSARAETTIR